MALPQGIDLRATLGFVTDVSPNFPEYQPGNVFPTVSTQGNNVGFEGGIALNYRDRQAGNDPRIAGLIRHTVAGDAFEYRIDLPSAGNYNVRLACGDGAHAQAVYMQVFDTSSSLGVLVNGTMGGGNRFFDATNTEYTAANWPAGNTAVQLTFATTIARFHTAGGSGERPVAYMYLEAVGGGGGVIKTWNGIAIADLKTINGIAVASIKTINGAAFQ